MFELGKTDHWWEIAKRHPSLSNHPNTLKPLGYAHIINLIESFKPKRVLEVGHGAMSFIFKIFADKLEMWGLDDVIEDSSVYAEDLENVRKWNPDVKFVSGLLGNFCKELPDNYFDLVYSVSVIEHIPHGVLPEVFRDTYRILKPGGIVSHSYDVYYRQSTKEVFDAYENAGFKWLKPRNTMNVFWEEWLAKPSDELIDELFDKIVFENPMEVAEKYMWQQDRNYRGSPINYMTVLNAGTKPYEAGNEPEAAKISLKVTDSPDEFTYSRRKHIEEFKKAGFDMDVYGKEIDPEYCDVKVYQNLLVYSLAKNSLKPGSRILEIGNNISPVTAVLAKAFDCSLLPLEKASQAVAEGVKTLDAEIGISSSSLPGNEYDLIYSLSSFGQEREGDLQNYDAKFGEIMRLLTPGGFAVVSVITLKKDPLIWSPEILRHFFGKGNTVNSFVPMMKVSVDEDLFHMSEKYYSDNWQKSTKKTFYKFGKPFAYTCFLKK